MTNQEIQALLDSATKQVMVAQSALDAVTAAAAQGRTALNQAAATVAQARAALDAPPPPPPPPPTALLPRFGGAPGFEIETLTAAAINTELNHWADVGCQILRYDLLQSTSYLPVFETILKGCEARGMKTIACLRGTSTPYGAAAAASYATAMATRFGSRVAVYGHAYDSVTGGQWATITSLDWQGKPLIITEAGASSANQAVQIPQQLTDPRAICVCTFSMQEGTWAILGHPGYAAYKAVPKS